MQIELNSVSRLHATDAPKLLIIALLVTASWTIVILAGTGVIAVISR